MLDANTDPVQLAVVESHNFMNLIGSLQITTAEEAQQAISLRSQLDERRKKIEAWFADPIAAAHRAHRELTQRRNEALAPFMEPRKSIDDKLARYETERRRQEQEAARQAEAQRQRLAEEARLQAALEAEAAGQPEEAEAILAGERSEEIVVVLPIATPTKPQGVAFVPVYSAEVVDLLELVKAIAAGTAPLDYIQANQVALNAAARRLGQHFKVAGCRLVTKTSVRGTPTA